jgi:Recombination endonuclease VII
MPRGQYVFFDPNKDLAEKIIDLYKRGFSAQKIVADLELNYTTPKTVLRWLRNHDIPVRRGGFLTNCISCCKDFHVNAPGQKICKTCAPDESWARRFMRYRLSKPEFDKLLESQFGLCGLCEQPLSDDIREVDIDHCHKQGHVRALLHTKCNMGLHYLEDDKFVAQAFRYIERHKR